MIGASLQASPPGGAGMSGLATPGSDQLFLWAGCVASHDVLARAEAVAAGEFRAMSILCADLVELEHERGWDPARVASELAARDVRVAVIDPYLDWYPGWDAAAARGPFAAGQRATEADVLRYADAMGAESVSVLGPFSGEPAEPEAVIEALGAFADVGAAHGLRLHVEMIPTSHIPDMEAAWGLIEEVDRANVGLVLDTFHLGRSGCDPAFLDRIPLEKVFHVQLCDAPRVPRFEDYFEEAVTERDFPGDGDLGVDAYVRHLTRDGVAPEMGPEVFSEELRSLGPAEAGRVCGQRTRAFLRSLEHPMGALETK